MKITTRRDALFGQLQTVTRAASTRSAVQALSGVQLLAGGEGIELRATDMEIGLRVPLEGEVVREGGVVLPGRLVVDVIRALPGDEVTLELRPAEQDVEIVGGSANFHIRTLRSEDFPPFPEPEGERVTVPGDKFVETVLKVARSASRDETRPVLTGILVSASGEDLRMVATDSYRLSVKETRLESALSGSFEANVPARALQELTRIVQHENAESLDVSVRANQVVFEVGGVVLSSRLIDGQFPNYRQLLPDAYEHELRMGGGGDRRGRAADLAAGAEERPAAAGVHGGRADGLGPHAGRRRGAGDAAGPVPGRAAGDRLQPRVPARRPGGGRGCRPDPEAHLAAAAGPDRGGRQQRLHLPADADTAECVIATRLSLRDFRSYAAADVRLGRGLTVVSGRNGAGKTNLLEALYFACTGRSCRTANERECVRFGAELARLELACEDAHGRHAIGVGFRPGESKHLRVDGAAVERLADVDARPLVSVFLPDRLELVVGAPALRRAHLDAVIAALWPARAQTKRAYASALAQRNALLGSIRAGRAGRSSLPAWDAELARHGVALMADRDGVVERLRPRFAEHAGRAGPRGRGRPALPAALARRERRRSWPRSWPSASPATSSAGSPATARTATTWRSSARGASCARTARAASSAWGCSRCCWPSARSWPPAAALLRCCCSTT